MFLSVDHLPVILSLPKISNSFLGMLLKAQSFTDESLEIFLYFLMFLEAYHISHLTDQVGEFQSRPVNGSGGAQRATGQGHTEAMVPCSAQTPTSFTCLPPV